MTNIDFKLREDDIEYARRMMKKDSNNATIYGPILVRFKNIGQRNYMFKNKKYLAEAKLENVINGAKKIFINENFIPQNKKNVLSCKLFQETILLEISLDIK